MPTPFMQSLQTLVSSHKHYLTDNAQLTDVGKVLAQARASTTVATADAGGARAGLDREMVTEQEREVQQQRHVQVSADWATLIKAAGPSLA